MPTLRRLRTRVPKARAVTPTPVRLAIAGAAIGVLTLVAAGAISIGVALIIVRPQKSPEAAGEPGGQAQKLPAKR
jgi:hypothetical protein